jgi:hypothetical protein
MYAEETEERTEEATEERAENHAGEALDQTSLQSQNWWDSFNVDATENASFRLWNEFGGKAEFDYLRAIGDTPFGFFSSSKTLSFAVRDAAQGHVLVYDLDLTMRELTSLLETCRSFSTDLKFVLSQKMHMHFTQCWNVLTYKLTKSFHFISVSDFDHALFYARSARHDLESLRELVDAVVLSMRVVVEYEESTRGGWMNWKTGSLFLGSMALISAIFKF